MFQSQISVFKEILIDNQTMFMFFRVAQEDELDTYGCIVPECVLSHDEWKLRLMVD